MEAANHLYPLPAITKRGVRTNDEADYSSIDPGIPQIEESWAHVDKRFVAFTALMTGNVFFLPGFRPISIHSIRMKS